MRGSRAHSANELYVLRAHIGFVRNRLNERLPAAKLVRKARGAWSMEMAIWRSAALHAKTPA